MAIYHLRLKVHSRSLGRAAKPGGATRRSAVAAAAYRSGEKLYDVSQGKWFDYEKPDVIHTEILAPEGAPDWVFDRQELWNRVEASERRADAQLCREVEVSCPRELSNEQCIELVRSFVQEQFVSRGMVADVNLHRPDASDGGEQPHAHCLLTLRPLDPTTATGFASKKERSWNEDPDIAKAVAGARKQYNNTGLEQDKQELEALEALRNVNVWRREWASYANRALATAGSTARIDHRTLEKQGIFRLPLPHIGLARHIEKAYGYLRERITQWVAVKKRTMLYNDLEHYKRRDPAKLADFVQRLSMMAEDFTAQYRRSPRQIPEVSIDR